MAWALTQAVHGTKGGGGNPVASLSSTASGSLLIAIMGGSAVGSNSASFTMPAGWTVVGSLYIATNVSSHEDLGFAYYWNNPGGITSVTGTWNDNGGNTSGWIELMEWTGARTGSDAYDSTEGVINNSVNGAGGTLSATINPTGATSETASITVPSGNVITAEGLIGFIGDTGNGTLVINAFSGDVSGSATNFSTPSGFTNVEAPYNFTGYNTNVGVFYVVSAAVAGFIPVFEDPIMHHPAYRM